jgi:tRNA-specific 2-thiouridylase
VPCEVRPTQDAATVVLDEPLRGVAPGQTVVWFDGEVAVGSATLDRTQARVPAGGPWS